MATQSSVSPPPPTEPDPNALESLDDLIKKREQEARRQREEQTQTDRPGDVSSAEASVNFKSSYQGGDESSHSYKPVSPSLPTSPARHENEAVIGDSSFSSRSTVKPRDERRWNGFHLWRAESYNNRTVRQREAIEAQRLAQKGNWFKRVTDACSSAVGRVIGTTHRGEEGLPNGESDHREASGDDREETQEAGGDDGAEEGMDSITRMILLTLVIAGAQMAWTLEFGYGTPYLLSLGLSKSATSLVWIAGPVSGLIAQPLIGVLSDLSTSRCRRRQYILSSTLVLSLSTLALAFSGPISSLLCDILHTGLADWDPRHKEAVKQINQGLAIVAFWVLDLSINSLQASARALILDATPSSMHSRANAWHGRMTHVGNVVGYAAGWANLGSSRALAWLGGDQFRKFAVVSIVGVSTCAIITSVSIQEAFSPPASEAMTGQPSSDASQNTVMSPTLEDHARLQGQARQRRRTPSPKFTKLMREALGYIWQSIRRLPRAVRRVCLVQLFAFMGWFPFLFYATQWLIETMQAERGSKDVSPSNEDVSDRDNETGSLALLLFAIVSLISGTVLPFFSLSNSKSPSQKPVQLEGPERQPLGRPSRAQRRVAGAGALHGEEDAFYNGNDHHDSAVADEVQDKASQAQSKSWIKSPRKLTLRTMWTISSIIYGIQASILTFFVNDSPKAAIVLIASIGVPWAVASWVPFALVMEAVREAEEGLSPFEFDADWFAPQQVRRRRRSSRMLSEERYRRHSRSFSGTSLGLTIGDESQGGATSAKEVEARRRVSRAILDCGELIPSSSSPSGRSRRRLSRNLTVESGSSPRRRMSGVEGSPPPAAAMVEVTNVEDDANDGSNANGDSLGGTVLGIHNLAIVVPQLVVAVVAALIFRATSASSISSSTFDMMGAFDSAGGGGDGKSGQGAGGAVVWVIRFGGLQSFLAAILTRFVPLTRTERAMRGDENLLRNVNLDDDEDEGDLSSELETA